MDPHSIYIHIPFCARKCLYCDFTSYPDRESLVVPYVGALRREIRAYASRFPQGRISTVYLGGGTPTILSADQLASVLDEVRSCFILDDVAEISSEANPATISVGVPGECDLRILWEAGFNRLSIGVQSFDDAELRQLGRVHSSTDAVDALHEARSAGLANISLDLMYGIPGQTMESWRRTLDTAVALQPEHISLYSLTVEEGTPFFAMRERGLLVLPSEDTEADMYEGAIGTLTQAGYLHYEISNFARPGFECRHNMTYWRNEPYLGFGAGASSYLDGVRATNCSSIESYISLVEQGKAPTEFEERLPEIESMGETMFLGLRMLRGVSIRLFQERYGLTPIQVFRSQIESLAQRDLIECDQDYVRLTRSGLMLANDVFAEFVGV